MVAFIVGNGGPSTDVEIYSPNGLCQHILAPLPIAILPNPILMYINGKVLVCAETVFAYAEPNHVCWMYKPSENKWEKFNTYKPWEQLNRYVKFY